MVGWLLPSGPSRLQLHTSPSAATRESRRNRTGSPRAASTGAALSASGFDIGSRVSTPQHSSSRLIVVGVLRAGTFTPIDRCRYDNHTDRIDQRQSIGE